MSSSYFPQDLPKLIGLVALYVLLAKLMVLLFGGNNVVSFLWLISGVALVIVQLNGYRVLPAAFIGALLGFWVIDTPLVFALVLALRHTMTLLIDVWLLQREARFDPELRTLPDFLRILALAFGFGLITAVFMSVVGWLSPSLVGGQSFNQRWAGHALGIIVVMPLVLVWRRLPRDWAVPRVAGEATLILSLSFLAGQVVFLDWFQDTLGQIARGHWMFLMIAWAGVRLGPHGAVLILTITAVQALTGAQLGTGFFANDMAKTQLANYFFYMASLSIVGMALATYVRGLKQAETRIRATKNQLRATLDAIPDLLFEVGLDGLIHDYHTHRTDLLAAPSDVLLGKHFSEVLPADAAEVCLAALREARAKGWSMGGQYALQLPQGKRWFELSVAPKTETTDPQGRFILLARDITERNQAEQALLEHASQLKMLSRRVLEAQETERRRVAIELHDELGQALTAIKINLQAHARLHDQTPAELNAENISIVETALQQVRRLALALRPSMLDDLGLVPALRWIAEQTEVRGDFVVQLRACELQSRLSPEIETACFRIVQESLTNIARHAQAGLVEIDLAQDADTLVLCVHDDGCGFDLDAMRQRAQAGGSMGLLGMEERATLIGGQLDIQSAPGQGCRVCLRCPLHLRGG